MLPKWGNWPAFPLCCVLYSQMDLCRGNAQNSNKLFTWKMSRRGHLRIHTWLAKKYFSLICSRNSAVQPFSLGLKSPVQDGNETRFSSLSFIWWNPTTPYHTGPVDPLWGSPRSFYITSHKDCRSTLSGAALHPRWCNVLPSLLCGLFYSKGNIKHDWVKLPMATLRDQLYYSWDFVPEVGSYTRNKMVKYQIGQWSYSCFILAGIRKNKEGGKKTLKPGIFI